MSPFGEMVVGKCRRFENNPNINKLSAAALFGRLLCCKNFAEEQDRIREGLHYANKYKTQFWKRPQWF